jgi:hypothetical protein
VVLATALLAISSSSSSSPKCQPQRIIQRVQHALGALGGGLLAQVSVPF